MATVPSKAELIRMITEAGSGLKPAELLPRIGGAAAVDALIDLLRNEPDPLAGVPSHGIGLLFRQNLISLLAELRDERAVAPLMECYDTYALVEDLIAHTLASRGITGQARCDNITLMSLVRQTGSISLKESPGYPLFAEKISASHLKANLDDQRAFAAQLWASWKVRSQAVKAVEQINREAGRDFFARVLEHDRDDKVRYWAALALGRLQDPLAIEGLSAFLQHEISESSWVPALIEEAIDVLAAIPGDRARQALRDFYERCEPASKSDLKLRAGWRLGLNLEPQPPSKPIPGPEPQPSKASCFIATAACGSPSAAEVLLLREFRDRYLLRHRVGAAFVALYQYLSPALADFIGPRAWCRRAVRLLLIRPVVVVLRLFRLTEPGSAGQTQAKPRSD
jgi:hypothetical protein